MIAGLYVGFWLGLFVAVAVWATIAGVWGEEGSSGPTPEELRRRHMRSIHTAYFGQFPERDQEGEAPYPKEPHVGHFDDTEFETAAYKALLAGAEERIDRIHHVEGSDL